MIDLTVLEGYRHGDSIIGQSIGAQLAECGNLLILLNQSLMIAPQLDPAAERSSLLALWAWQSLLVC
jgi:hypothetical protein